MQDRGFYASLIGFLLGVVWGEVAGWDLRFLLVVLMAVMLSSWYLWRKRAIWETVTTERGGERRYLSLAAVFLVAVGGFVLGTWRVGQVPPVQFDPLATIVGEKVELVGHISAEPTEKDNRTQLIITIDKVGEQKLKQPVRLSTFVPRYPEYSYGDRVSFSGKLKYPEDFVTDTGRIFHYRSWLGKDKIWYVSYYPRITLLAPAKPGLLTFLYGAKARMTDTLNRYLSEPQSSLAGGLLLGTKSSLGKEALDNFRAVGLIHIIVLSGFNVAVVVIAIMWALRPLPKRWGMVMGMVGIVLFVLLVGAGAPVVRAGIMAGLIIWGRALGRTPDVLRLLFIAGVMMIIANPHTLVYDPSFQLSFMATIGLILGVPAFLEQKWVQTIPTALGWREYFLTTVVTQIAVLPLLLYLVGEISLVAVPANLLVLPIIPIVMLLSFLLILFGWLSPLATVIAWLVFALLKYVFLVVNFLASLPFVTAQVRFPGWLALLIYALLAGYFLIRKKPDTTQPKIGDLL